MDLHHIILDAVDVHEGPEDEHFHARDLFDRLHQEARETGSLDAETEARFESRVRDSLTPFSRPRG